MTRNEAMQKLIELYKNGLSETPDCSSAYDQGVLKELEAFKATPTEARQLMMTSIAGTRRDLIEDHFMFAHRLGLFFDDVGQTLKAFDSELATYEKLVGERQDQIDNRLQITQDNVSKLAQQMAELRKQVEKKTGEKKTGEKK